MKDKFSIHDKTSTARPRRRLGLWFIYLATGIALLSGPVVSQAQGKRPVPTPDAAAVGGNDLKFQIDLGAPTIRTFRYDANTSDDTAIAGSDYEALSTHVQFNAGEKTAYVTVQTYKNTQYTSFTVLQFKLTLDNIKVKGQDPGTWVSAAFSPDSGIPSKIELTGVVYQGPDGDETLSNLNNN